MIHIYTRSNDLLKKTMWDVNSNEVLPEEPIWIDLINITPQEESVIENYLGIDIPTSEEVKQIEISQRLYHQQGAIYMTATIVAEAETAGPQSQAVTFILYKNYFITVRYCELSTFSTFSTHITKKPLESIHSSQGLFVGLMDAIISRIGDTLETIRKNIDEAAAVVFGANMEEAGKGAKNVNYKDVMKKIGMNGTVIAKARESLGSLYRVISYMEESKIIELSKETESQLHILSKDVSSLSDYAHFQSNETTFLLDATLGMISIEQNNTIKIMSVMASMFLPPTLIASIYGMNFHFMPELTWKYGYPSALILMILSIFIPYKYCKKQGWV